MKFPLFEVVQIPVELLEVPAHTVVEMSQPENIKLKESIRLCGIKRTLVVYPLENGKFLVRNGTHRAQCLEPGRTAPCIVISRDPKCLKSIRILANAAAFTFSKEPVGFDAQTGKPLSPAPIKSTTLKTCKTHHIRYK